MRGSLELLRRRRQAGRQAPAAPAGKTVPPARRRPQGVLSVLGIPSGGPPSREMPPRRSPAPPARSGPRCAGSASAIRVSVVSDGSSWRGVVPQLGVSPRRDSGMVPRPTHPAVEKPSRSPPAAPRQPLSAPCRFARGSSSVWTGGRTPKLIHRGAEGGSGARVGGGELQRLRENRVLGLQERRRVPPPSPPPPLQPPVLHSSLDFLSNEKRESELDSDRTCTTNERAGGWREDGPPWARGTEPPGRPAGARAPWPPRAAPARARGPWGRGR